MMIHNDDGTVTAGPLDVLLIQEKDGRFHVAFYEEAPMPGPVEDVPNTKVVRLKSKMHHTGGADTFAQALEQLAELRKKLHVEDVNVVSGRAVPVEDHVGVLCVSNWRRAGSPTLTELLFPAGVAS